MRDVKFGRDGTADRLDDMGFFGYFQLDVLMLCKYTSNRLSLAEKACFFFKSETISVLM